MKRIKIGVAITTRNRRIIAYETFSKWAATIDELNAHHGEFVAKLYIVDDASEQRAGSAMFTNTFHRFDENVGIARAKNKCIELMHDNGCSFMFLVDDDCYVSQFHRLFDYINSGLEHACYTFNRRTIRQEANFTEYEMPSGCFVFVTRKCVDTIGGYAPYFNGYGYEHVNFSDRIFNAGLTPARYIDIFRHKNRTASSEIISLDEQGTIEKSVPYDVRINSIPVNYKRYLQKYNSKEFIPFR